MSKLIDKIFRKLGAETAEKRRELVLQFIKFGFVGLSNTVVAWTVYYFLLWLNDDLYMVGSIAGTIVGIRNDRFVFKGGENDLGSKLKRLMKTYVSYGGTFLLSTVLLWVEVEFIGVSKAAAPVINLIITTPLNFLINKFWTFRNSKKT